MSTVPITLRQEELRRSADHLDARAEVEERLALHGPDARAHRARCFELRSVAAIRRSQANAMAAR